MQCSRFSTRHSTRRPFLCAPHAPQYCSTECAPLRHPHPTCCNPPAPSPRLPSTCPASRSKSTLAPATVPPTHSHPESEKCTVLLSHALRDPIHQIRDK